MSSLMREKDVGLRREVLRTAAGLNAPWVREFLVEAAESLLEVVLVLLWVRL